MLKLYQKRTDIEDLQVLLIELGVNVDLDIEDLQGYDSPNYSKIKQILVERLALEKVIPGQEYIWSDPVS